MGKTSIGGIFLGAVLLLAASLSQAAEFTATVVTKAGGMEIPGKVYVKDKKIRNEVEAASISGIHIMRPDKKVIWVIIPQQKAYMEMPLSQEAQQKMMLLTENQKANLKKVGSETVNGYATDKYETSMSYQGKSMKIFTWIAADLGMPIKVVSEDGSFSLEYKDIKPGQVADSLFEPPPGFNKMNMPLSLPTMK
ncbi:MAG: DUF4412 domain-containing protein [Desulfobaccales bacterium]